jgi:hypothetical protein
MRTPTSTILARLADEAPGGDVSLAWVMENLQARSFGLVMLLLALLASIPGLSPVAAVLIVMPALQMIRGHDRPVLPARLARRRISSERLRALLRRLVPPLVWLERIVRPRWPTPFQVTKRGIGSLVLLLSATLLTPVPFSQLLPAGAIALLSIAFLEEDGILLAISLLVSLVSLAITAALAWGAFEAGRLI